MGTCCYQNKVHVIVTCKVVAKPTIPAHPPSIISASWHHSGAARMAWLPYISGSIFKMVASLDMYMHICTCTSNSLIHSILSMVDTVLVPDAIHTDTTKKVCEVRRTASRSLDMHCSTSITSR